LAAPFNTKDNYSGIPTLLREFLFKALTDEKSIPRSDLLVFGAGIGKELKWITSRFSDANVGLYEPVRRDTLILDKEVRSKFMSSRFKKQNLQSSVSDRLSYTFEKFNYKTSNLIMLASNYLHYEVIQHLLGTTNKREYERVHQSNDIKIALVFGPCTDQGTPGFLYKFRDYLEYVPTMTEYFEWLLHYSHAEKPYDMYSIDILDVLEQSSLGKDPIIRAMRVNPYTKCLVIARVDAGPLYDPDRLKRFGFKPIFSKNVEVLSSSLTN
jgi:hypothetical protein